MTLPEDVDVGSSSSYRILIHFLSSQIRLWSSVKTQTNPLPTLRYDLYTIVKNLLEITTQELLFLFLRERNTIRKKCTSIADHPAPFKRSKLRICKACINHWFAVSFILSGSNPPILSLFFLLSLIYNYMKNIMFTRLSPIPCPPHKPLYSHCPSA